MKGFATIKEVSLLPYDEKKNRFFCRVIEKDYIRGENHALKLSKNFSQKNLTNIIFYSNICPN